MNLIRKCPKCNADIVYSNKNSFDRGTKRNSDCRSCVRKRCYTNEMRVASSIRLHKIMAGRTVSEITKDRIRKSLTGTSLSDERIEKIRKAHTGKILGPHSAQHKLNLRKSLIKYGKHSDERRKNIRKARIRYIKEFNNGKMFPTVGRNENKLLDIQEKLDGCKIERNFEIHSLGYFPDGYCKETNTVYEVYEKFHDNQVIHDLKRETEICEFLGCDFVILWDK